MSTKARAPIADVSFRHVSMALVTVVALALAPSVRGQDTDGVKVIVDISKIQSGDVELLSNAQIEARADNTVEVDIEIAVTLCAIDMASLMAKPKPLTCEAKIEGVDTLMMLL
jgi:hypothetical protein